MIRTPSSRSMVWWLYAGLAFLTVVLTFVISNSRTSGTLPSESDFEKITRADWQVKVHLAQQFASKNVPSKTPPDGEAQLPEANTSYLLAGSTPSAIRRSAILSDVLGYKDAHKTFHLLTSSAVLEKVSAVDAEDLKGEAVMWQSIYSEKPISSGQLSHYASRISAMNLGPVKGFALQKLYLKAGKQELAAQAIEDAELRATVSLVVCAAIVILWGLLALSGIVFLILFVLKRNRWLREPSTEKATVAHIQPEESAAGEVAEDATFEIAEQCEKDIRSRKGIMLFQGFALYMLITLALSVIINTIAAPVITDLHREQRLIYVIAIVYFSAILSGGIGIVYTLGLLRIIRCGLASIGLRTDSLGRDVLWGIAGYSACLPLMLLATLLSHSLFRRFETPTNPIVPMVLGGNTGTFIAVLVIASVLAPFFEEVFFRGMLYGGLRTRLGIVPAVILSSAAFAFLHPFPGTLLPIMTLGSVFAILFEVRKSLVSSMVAHALNNGILSFVLYFIAAA